MRFAQRTDYALRVLMHLALTEEVTSVGEIASRFRISENHVMKVAQELARAGWVEAQRGRGGGLRLAVPVDGVTVGAVVRRFEPDFRLVECFDASVNDCVITPACALRAKLEQAAGALLAVLDDVTLEDVTHNRRHLSTLLQIV